VKAVVAREHGAPGVLAVADVPLVEPGFREVRVRVHAAGINPVDAANRMDGTWAGVRAPFVPGYDIAGTVDAVGEGVTDVRPGMRVMALTAFPRGQGGYAQYAVVSCDAVVPISDSTSYESAAATPLAGGTADDILARLDLPDGARLLVLGASGGVGSFLLQLARLRGLDAVALGATRHHDRLRALGASACVDYARSDAPEAVLTGGQIDAVADLVGGSSLTTMLPALRDGGQVATIATPELDIDTVVDRNLTVHGVLIADDGERTRRLAALLASGELVGHVAHAFPYERATEAHQLLDQGHAGGKIVLTGWVETDTDLGA
jgi:NADPH:quinone reductase